jgi:hypothetical protein
MARHACRTGRWTDRVEDVAAWVLLAAGLLVVLFGCAFGVRTHDRLIQQGQSEALDRTPATATLLSDAPIVSSLYATGSAVGANATWQDRSGAAHTGIVTAPQGLDAGSTLTIWIDRTGAEVTAPTSSGDALTVAAIAVGIVIVGGVSILAGLWEVLRRVVLAYNCGAWEQEWREVAPIWSRGEGKRG